MSGEATRAAMETMEHTHAATHGARARAEGEGPGVRNERRPEHGEAFGRARRARPTISAAAAAARSSSPTRRAISRRLRASRSRAAAPEGAIYTCPMHPEIRQVGPGACPICGMALEPVDGDRGERPERRADRHDAPVLDRAGARGPGRGARDGRPFPRSRPLDRADRFQLDSARLRDAGGALGRRAVLRARLALARHAQSQHVHADRHGDGRRLALQRRRDPRARALPAGLPRHARHGRRLFRGGGDDHRAGAPRPGA